MWDFIVYIFIGGVAGWIVEKLLKRDDGLIMNIMLGIAGSVIGNWILGKLELSFGETWVARIAVAVGGAVLLVYIVNLIRGKK